MRCRCGVNAAPRANAAPWICCGRRLHSIPTFARAHSLLGNVYVTMIYYAGLRYDEMMPLAHQAAEKALQLDPNDSDALMVLGALARGRFDWVGSAELLSAAKTVDPSNSTAQQRYAELLFAQGYLRRGVAESEAAVRIDPISASVRSVDALAAIFAGRSGARANASRRDARARLTARRSIGVLGVCRAR